MTPRSGFRATGTAITGRCSEMSTDSAPGTGSLRVGCEGLKGTRMNRKAAVAWTLYDFANSAFVAVIPATGYSKYYALAVVGNERGQGDFWWALAVTTSMAIVALSSPPLG